MSHVVTVKAECKNADVLAEACERLGFAPPVYGVHRMYPSNVEGWAVTVPGTYAPVVFDREGLAHYDGDYARSRVVDPVVQAYNVANAARVARAAGKDVTERKLADGTIALEVVDSATPDEAVRVNARPDGEVVVEAHGFKGAGCKDATRALSAALGTVTADKPTQAMYEAESEVELHVDQDA